ncbi:MAG: hypothetical protein DHS20C19_00360 [Acidimicrobiales bacterium]|nr:MAG: hypothetical protein DHS20C19_00360 [Acidimicrobiales bacterium]
MPNTPRIRFAAGARFGWDAFPCDPARFYERLRPVADGKSHVNKYTSERRELLVVGRTLSRRRR